MVSSPFAKSANQASNNVTASMSWEPWQSMAFDEVHTHCGRLPLNIQRKSKGRPSIATETCASRLFVQELARRAGTVPRHPLHVW